MKIENRKNTTEAGLEALRVLITGLEEKMKNDIKNFEVIGHDFFCVEKFDNGRSCGDYHYVSWYNDTGRLVFKNGKIEIKTTSDENQRWNDNEGILEIFKISFPKIIEALEALVKEYNERSKKKDEDIEKFLKLVRSFSL